MAARARTADPRGTGSVREVFLLVSLGLFMVVYGGQGIGAEDEPTLLLLTSSFAMAAGVAFLLAAFFGARRALRQRRR